MIRPSKKSKFKPKPGQVDFTNIRWAPVVNCVVKHRNKILLVKRHAGMKLYPNCWNGISGFLDDKKSLKEKVVSELKEELGLNPKSIKSIKLGEIFDQEEPKYRKTWVVHPVLAEIKTSKLRLNWEAQDYKWIRPREIKNLKLMPGFKKVFGSFF
ncbi:MAG: hypothetical protein G01um1014107_87 [Parcubacteria group bacterium Gr01-1014_107]|nr:MAG: hypothetical protein G01um1014107_87 [Parcubacteria group bacterium Gr01-1014_107]